MIYHMIVHRHYFNCILPYGSRTHSKLCMTINRMNNHDDNEPPPKDRNNRQDSKLQKRIKATAEHALVKAFNLMVTTLTTGNYKGSSSRGSGI